MERPLTQNLNFADPPDLKTYEKGGGYQALKKALRELEPQEITERVKQSGLRGRGGGGFPTGMKWGFVPQGEDAPQPKYLVANADEMEPGTFKDRWLMEGNPHLLVESMALAAYAIGAGVGYVFLRWAYRRSAHLLSRAIHEARDAGYLGDDICGQGFSFDLHLHESAGRYMCGEETGLLNALEGYRAVPRSKPPYPQASGLWGQPTVVQNVETLCNVPAIIGGGVDWYKSLSRTEEGGTKLYGVSGKVKNPSLWELPMGTTPREILYEHAGGLRDGLHFKGLIPGGASTDFLVEEHLDTPMDFDSIQKVGSRLGTGTMIILDDATCPVGLVANLERFFARESCGWCTPCREGLPWTARILEALEAGEGKSEDLDHLEMHARNLGPGLTFCALAPGAMEPLGSALKCFRDDFERHVHSGRCPWR